jgi:catechol 2,3-dioxygenase-like lactoylglutathione lyase family enzyme
VFAAFSGTKKQIMSVNVRYIVKSVEDSISFYTQKLGFKVDFHPAPGFAALSKDNLKLYINSPGAGGAGQSMPDGTVPSPGGWNRFQIEVNNLKDFVSKLKKDNASFRNEIVKGQGGDQILLEDPSGNLIELFEPKSN